MLRFEHPYFLHLLWAIPVLLLVWQLYRFWRRRALARIGSARSVSRLAQGWSGPRFFLKNGLVLLALALMAVAWANPQRGAKKQTASQKSADVLIALDISQSMLAEDVPPSRLDLAKSFARKLVEALHGERIGLIFFAGDAFLQMPLSTDYGAADMFVSAADPDMITAQGTAFSRAIQLAEAAFEPDGGGRALILITDGENHEDGAADRAAEAYGAGTVILAVGAGTEAGGPIPLADVSGGSQYKRDAEGAVVRTRLDYPQLQTIARRGGGSAYLLTQGDAAIRAIRQEVDRLQKRDVQLRSFTEFESYFQWFLAPAFLLLGLEAWLSWRSGKAA